MPQTLQEFYSTINAGRPTVAVPAVLLHAMSASQALLLAQLLWWCEQGGGTAQKSSSEIEEATGLDRYQQRRVMQQLAQFGLKAERHGVPPTNRFSVDREVLANACKPHMCGNATIQLCGSVTIDCADSQQSIVHKTQQLTSTNRRIIKEGGEKIVGEPATASPTEPPPVATLPKSQITIARQEPVEVPVRLSAAERPTAANPYPRGSTHEGLDAENKILAAAPRLGGRLVELRRISGRTEHNYRLWLRDFVAPHVERLGPNFSGALEAALKAGVLANPSFALRDVVKALEEATPPSKEAMRRQSEKDMFEDLIARLAAGTLGTDHGPN